MSKGLRNLTPQDALSLHEIAKESFTVVWSEKDFLYFLTHPQGLALGLEEEGMLVGFFLGLLVQGELDIVSLGVKTSSRRSGIGSALVEAALKSSAGPAYLEVDETNTAAIAMYEKLGFKKMGIRKKYYEGKRDAWFMKKS